MRDRIVMASPTGFLLNGDRYALSVTCGARLQPIRLELIRKSDLRVLVRRGPDRRLDPARSYGTPLLRSAHEELLRLIRRLPSDRGGRDHPSPRTDASSRVGTLLRRLGVDAAILERYQLEPCREPYRLEYAGNDLYGRSLWLTKETCNALSRLRSAAFGQGIRVAAVSGFRSIDYQARLIAAKLRRGQTIDQILSVSALPGYSEHHLGTTVDFHDGDGPTLETSFEHTAAFGWLQAHADRFGFRLSYPRDNPYGIAYEPWHWRYRSPTLAIAS